MGIVFDYWDVGLLLILSAIHLVAWLGERGRYNEINAKTTKSERQFAANNISSSSNAGIVAVSILIPAALLLSDSSLMQDKPELIHVLLRSTAWFTISLLFGLWVIFITPLRSRSYDARILLSIGIPFGWQLLSLFVGTVLLLTTVIRMIA